MLQFCPDNQSLVHPWVNNGLNRCFVDTLSTTILSILIVLPGCWVNYSLKKHGRLLTDSLRQNSKLWVAHQAICWLIATVLFVQSIVFAFARAAEHVYGFLVYAVMVNPLLWVFSIMLLRMDCKRQILQSQHRHHNPVLLCFWSGALICSFIPLVSIRSSDWWWSMSSSLDISEFIIWLLLTTSVVLVFVLGWIAPGLARSSDAYSFLQSEQLSDQSPADSSQPKARGWSQAFRRAKLVAPFIWPRDDRLVQLRVLICVVLLVVGRLVNVYTPIFYKQVVDSLTFSVNGTHVNHTRILETTNDFTQRIVRGLFGANGLVFRWDYVLEFMGLRFLQGMGGVGGGLISALRMQLWVAVDQYSSRELSVVLFAHLQNLSLQWHLSRKTGEMLRIMDRGTASISNVLSYLVFNIIPTVLDIIIGVIYFVMVFNFWYGLLVFVTMAVYMAIPTYSLMFPLITIIMQHFWSTFLSRFTGLTIVITQWRVKYRRAMNRADNQKSTKAVDALLNFETVKYFNAERFEVERFRQAFVDFQQCEWLSQTTLNTLNLAQTFIITLGLLIGTMICARDVVLDRLTVGDFVLFNTYILQLYSPLSLFGTYYRLLQTSVVDMENMFELLDIRSDLTDDPDAPNLVINGGSIEFKNVCFHYTAERPILKNISFKVPGGRTVALVGQSGAGKSTIVRILFRFYDVTAGEILIDGQNIAHVTQSSLRRAIGVVPQDTVLFNDTIRYNIHYGRLDATEDEVRRAAVKADIHDRICEFPQAYDTIVGERGLKLSGGEKQRVAIARNFLKDPRILMLDEATSALDTATERNIQASLNDIACNRSTLVVAHRLSTIIHADEILMMHQGEIIERGTHAELLTIPNGCYAALWRAQSEAQSTEIDSPGELPNFDAATDEPMRV
ncbi:ATP-binding cassette sub-family B member 6 mitochondrial [Fasciola gigantica]|uniref:ATP-binding cassette sub-family B member 6 n=1 Tax=Fasciola gigantica TaxID=46835 RepID=A0A504YSY1_FASGI|nr:ATP-binding cassette sub-family B member 6 mitochondrial [Fasciola gigantica]